MKKKSNDFEMKQLGTKLLEKKQEEWEIGLELNFAHPKLEKIRGKTNQDILKVIKPFAAKHLEVIVKNAITNTSRKVVTEIEIYKNKKFTLNINKTHEEQINKITDEFKELKNTDSVTKEGYLFTVAYYSKDSKKILKWKFTYDPGVVEIIIEKQSWEKYIDQSMRSVLQNDIFDCMNSFQIDGLHTHLNLDFNTVFENKASYVLSWARDQERINISTYLKALNREINKYYFQNKNDDFDKSYFELGEKKVKEYFKTKDDKDNIKESYTKKLREYFNSPYMWEINSIVFDNTIKGYDLFEMNRIIGFCIYDAHKICLILSKKLLKVALLKKNKKDIIYIENICTAIENLSCVFDKEDKNFLAVKTFYTKLLELYNDNDEKIETTKLQKICNHFKQEVKERGDQILEIFKLSLLQDEQIAKLKNYDELKKYFTMSKDGLEELKTFYKNCGKTVYVGHMQVQNIDSFLKYRCINIINIDNSSSDLRRVEYRRLHSKKTFGETIADVNEILNSIAISKNKINTFLEKKKNK